METTIAMKIIVNLVLIVALLLAMTAAEARGLWVTASVCGLILVFGLIVEVDVRVKNDDKP